MMKRILSFLLVAIAVTSPVAAQKELKALRAFVKAKNTSEAMKEVARLEKDSICRFMPKLYELAAKAQIQINDVENEKVYLKKACDTAKLFESTRQIFYYIHKADSLERCLMEMQGKHHTRDKDKVKLLQRYHKNLVAGTRYFYARKNYKEAQRHLDMLLSLVDSPLCGVIRVDTLSEDYAVDAYMFTFSAFQNNDFSAVERYKTLLFNHPRYYPSTLEMYARVANASGKLEKFEEYLRKGAEEFPLQHYFFDELASIYVADERYSQAIVLADQQLSADSTSLRAMYLKAHALYKLEDEAPCIEVCKKLTAADTAHHYVDANYYAGLFIMNKLQTIYLPTRIGSKAFERAKNEMKNVCEEARPYLETYRKYSPSQHEKWAPLLYRVYLELNMGPEFEDVSRYVH